MAVEEMTTEYGDEKGEETTTAPPRSTYVLTVRVEKARGLFRTNRDDDDKKGKDKGAKAGKGKKPDKKGAVKGKGKGGKDAEEDDEPKLPPIRTAIKLKPFPLLEIKPKDITDEAESAENPVGEDPFMSQIMEDLSPEYSFETLHIIEDRMMFLDNVCVTPFELELVQCLGIKEQPKGYTGPPQEATELFGSLSLDLTSFLDGKTTIKQWASLNVPAAVIEAGAAMATHGKDNEEEVDSSLAVAALPIPEVQVSLSLDKVLLEDWEREQSNLFTLTVTQLVNLPKEWAEGHETMGPSNDSIPQEELDFEDRFTLAYAMPLADERDRPLEFTGNAIKVTDHSKTQEAPLSEPAAPIEAKKPGTASGKKKKDGKGDPSTARSIQELDNLSVDVGFVYARRSFVAPDAGLRLLESIRNEATFDLLLTAQRVGLDDKETEPRLLRQGKVAIDLKTLLKPGATSAEGRFEVVSVEPEPADELDVKPNTAKKGSKAKKSARGGVDGASDKPAQSFQEARTMLCFKLTLDKPLNPKKPTLSVNALLGEEVEKKKISKVSKLETAEGKLDKEIAAVTGRMLQALASESGHDTTPDEAYASLLMNCNRSGLYGQCLDRLQPLVIEYIKAKFYRKLPGVEHAVSKETMVNQLMMSLSGYINNALGHAPTTMSPLNETPLARAIRLAAHNEQAEDFKAATTAHLNAVSTSVGDTVIAQTYYNYAAFSMRQGDLDGASQALRRSLKHSPSYWPSLVASVVASLHWNMVEQALPHVEKLRTCSASGHPVVLVVIALYHMLAEEDEEAWDTLSKAAKKLQSLSAEERVGDPVIQELFGACPRDLLSLPMLQSWTSDSQANEDVWLEAVYIVLARTLMCFNLFSLAYSVLTGSRSRQPGEIGVSTSAPYTSEVLDVGTVGGSDVLCFARAVHLVELFMRAGRLSKARGLSEKAEELVAQGTPSPHALLHLKAVMGHLHYASRNEEAAVAYYQDYLTQQKELNQSVLDPIVCLRLDRLLEGNPDHLEFRLGVMRQMAQDSAHCRSANAWLGLASAAAQLDQLSLAEHALAEAGVLSDQHPQIWALVALVALMRACAIEDGEEGPAEQSRTQLLQEAQQAFELALQYGSVSPNLLNQLGQHFAELQLTNSAAVAYRASLAQASDEAVEAQLEEVIMQAA